MKNIFKIVISISFLLLISGKVSAIEFESLGGRPLYPNADIPNSAAWFIYNLDLGQSKEDALVVINNHEVALDVVVYAADGVKSSNGGFAIRQFVEPKEEVGSWVKFYPEPVPSAFKTLFKSKDNSILKFCATDITNSFSTANIEEFNTWCKGVEVVQVNVKSLGKQEIKFVFTVPQSAEVGEHTGGIVIQKAEPKTSETGTDQGISLKTRVGIRIYQTVPGDILKELRIKEFTVTKNWNDFDFSRIFNKKDQKPESFTVHTVIENVGNVSVALSETIDISDNLFNKSGQKIADRNFQVLRDDSFQSNYDWENPRFGKFTLVSNIMYTDQDNKDHVLSTGKVTLWIIPWRESVVALIIMVILAIPVTIFRIAQKKKYGGKGWREYIVQSGDTLDSITTRFDVNWKVFVKTNNIKPPYLLKARQKVLVPPKKR